MNQKNVGVVALGDPKNQRGITLIALVITIIVLLILAGVTISMVLGDDGIIAQAQQAKKEQEKAAEKEQEEIQKAQGNIDLYTEGTIARTVQVGDYVEYNYTAPEDGYTTPEVGTGKEVNTETERFDSSIATEAVDGTKAAKVERWRVLSKKDGIVELVAETPISGELTLNEGMGWVNGTDVLNEMCKTLYSSSIGTARSITIEDVNEVTGYEVPEVLTEAVFDTNGEAIEIPYGATIKEVAKIAGENGTEYEIPDYWVSPEEGKDIGDYELNRYEYDVINDTDLTVEDEEYKILFRTVDNMNDLPAYWLASTMLYVDFSCYDAWFIMRSVNQTSYFKLGSDNMFTAGNTESIAPSYAVRPIITLNTGLEIEGGIGDSTNPWQIKGN